MKPSEEAGNLSLPGCSSKNNDGSKRRGLQPGKTFESVLSSWNMADDLLRYSSDQPFFSGKE